MLGRSVSGVSFPPIVRVFIRGLAHQPVAMLLGDDRGGGNTGLDRIPANDRTRGPAPFRASTMWRKVAIDKNLVNRLLFRKLTTQVRNGKRHCQHRGPEDIEAIDLVRLDHANRPPAAALDLLFHDCAARGRKLLGIVETRRSGTTQDHRRRHDWPGQRPPPCLVHADNDAI